MKNLLGLPLTVKVALPIFKPLMPEPANEIELLSLVANGDEAAFRQLYLRHYPTLRHYVYRLTESVDTADEVVQDVFLKIWQTREALEGIENFSAYLFVVSKNYALSLLRKHVRETIKHQKWKAEEAHQAADDAPSVDYYGLLDEAIDTLPPQQKTAYLLSRHQRLTYAEAAEQMGLSKETVKSYLQLATAAITNHVKARMNLD